MRKQITTIALAATVAMSTSFAAHAGGLAPVEVAPTVFVDDTDDGSMGSLGGLGGIALAALLIGAAIALSDDDSEADSTSDSDG